MKLRELMALVEKFGPDNTVLITPGPNACF